jgi:hypothetical protein
MATKKFACPCCEFLTLDEPPPGTFLICPVCHWEDDNVQFCDPHVSGGANFMSLDEARDTFRRIGAISESALRFVRPARQDEYPT